MSPQDFFKDARRVETSSGRIGYVQRGSRSVALFVHRVVLNGISGDTYWNVSERTIGAHVLRARWRQDQLFARPASRPSHPAARPWIFAPARS